MKAEKTISINILKVKSVKFLTTDNSLNLRQIYYALENEDVRETNPLCRVSKISVLSLCLMINFNLAGFSKA
jgi:hypothetical protein